MSSLLVLFAVLSASAVFVNAQAPVLCDTAGCKNGECLVAGAASRCLCYTGFAIRNDVNVCEDINECAIVPDLCPAVPYPPTPNFFYFTFQYLFNTVNTATTPTTCINTPGSYYCAPNLVLPRPRRPNFPSPPTNLPAQG